MNKDNTGGLFSLGDAGIGKYRLNLTVDGSTLSTLITVKDSLRFKQVSYSVTGFNRFPNNLDTTISHPDKIKALENTQEGYFLHLGVSAEFVKATGEHPT
jgi:hypothetical protein